MTLTTSFIKNTILTILIIFLASCGDNNKPTHDILAKELDTIFYHTINLQTISLEKTNQSGNMITYNVSGKFEINETLYEPIVNLSSNLIAVTAAYKKGDLYPFTASLESMGNSDTGWNLKFSNIATKLQIKLNLLPNQIVNDSSQYVVVNTANFKQKMNDLKKELTNNLTKIPLLQEEIENLLAEEQELDNQAKQIQQDKYTQLDNEQSKYNVWSTNYTNDNPRRDIVNYWDNKKREALAELKACELYLLPQKYRNLRSKTVLSQSNSILKDDGTSWTIAEIDVEIQVLERKYEAVKQQILDDNMTQYREAIKTWEAPINEHKQALEQNKVLINDNYKLLLADNNKAQQTIRNKIHENSQFIANMRQENNLFSNGYATLEKLNLLQ